MRTTVIFVGDGSAAPAPLRLIVPAIDSVFEPLLSLARACAGGAREINVPFADDGPDAEAALLDAWLALSDDDRAKAWGAVGAMAGTLARLPDIRTVGLAVLSTTGPGPEQARNAQARSLLMASVADSWSLALDQGPPADAERWRRLVQSTARARWHVAVWQDGDISQVFGAALSLATVSTPIIRNPAPPTAVGAPVGWLDEELLDTGRRDHFFGQPPSSPTTAATVAGPRKFLEIIHGRHGRLFLGQDTHDSHRQMTGHHRMSGEEVETWAQGTAARLADISATGAHFVQLLAPAPQVVHAEDLPEGMGLSADRPAQQIVNRLARLEPAPRIVYPVDALRDIRGFRDPFGKTESHWNDLAAYLAYEAMLDALPQEIAVRRVGRADVSFIETCWVGDLGDKLRPERACVFLRARVDAPAARVVADNRVRNHGRSVTYQCDAAPPTTCVLFGESSAYPMMPFLAESFRRLVFFHRINVVDRALIAAERPDVVLSILSERAFTSLPTDDQAVGFDHVVANKLRKNDLVPEASPEEPYPYVYSLALDRGLAGRTAFKLPVRAATAL